MRRRLFFSPMIFLAFFGLLLLLGWTGQQKSGEAERHEVRVRLVLVDAIVTKDGNFVTDLTKDDVEIYEDGKKVPVNSFELISFGERIVTAEEKPAAQIGGVPRKQLVVVFDGISSWSRSLKEGSRKLVDELISLARMGNEVMIIQLSERKGLEVLQDFTTDEALIKKAMVRASGTIWVDKSLDAVKMLQEVGIEAADIMEEGTRYTEKLQPVLEDEYLYVERTRFEKALGGLLAVANMIKDIAGRKSILFISDGFPDISAKTLDSKVTEAEAPGTVSGARSPQLDIRRDTAQVRVFDPFNILQKKKIMSAEEVIRELIRFSNAHNISIYALDPESFVKYLMLATAEYGPRETVMQSLGLREKDKISRVQNLRWLAEDTGGASLIGATKYDRFSTIMSTDLNSYYQLSYYPPRKEPDNAYHKIDVKVLRSGCDVRSRKGYTDYSDSEAKRIQLVSAFYSPQLFKALPFEGEFVFFHKASDKFEPWMNIALPTRELFLKRGVAEGSQVFSLIVWVKDRKSGGSAFGGQINIPFKIDSSFREIIESTDYICFHYKGAEMPFARQEYEAVFALCDQQTDEIGTWVSTLSLPDPKSAKDGAVINCVLGVLTQNPGGKKQFSLSKEDGGLEYGDVIFYPGVTNRFGFQQDACAFLQVYWPSEKIQVSPQFSIVRGGRAVQPVAGEIVAEAYDKKAKTWSGLINLNLQTVMPGDYALRVDIPLSAPGGVLTKEVPLSKLNY
ncbi:MAG: VWA domain-containing protein [Clostridiales bacterium]|nr:VWA domain-containing protein [Clostridiales bacterium]